MPFRIAIDARRIGDFGTGTYLRNLIRGLARLDHANSYTLVRRSGDLAEFGGLPPNFETVVYDRTDRSALLQIRYRLFLKRHRADVYHLPINVVPFWMPKPYIVTVHDVGNLIFENRGGLRNDFNLYRARRGL